VRVVYMLYVRWFWEMLMWISVFGGWIMGLMWFGDCSTEVSKRCEAYNSGAYRFGRLGRWIKVL